MKEYCLADLIDIKHGFAFDGEHITSDDNGIVLVTPGNFKIGGGFQEDKCKFFDGDIPEEFVLKPGAYIVTMTDLSKGIDTLGYTAIVPKNAKRTYLHNQRIGLISFLSDECDKDYLYYLMQSRDYQREIANTSTGSTVHHTSPSRIRSYKFLAPDIQIQRFIAKTLRAYDDLIENNQKQIKLLEEAAQRLYKEWFVDLRFPGYETAKIVDGVPEGWTYREISSFGEIITGKTPSTAESSYYGGAVPFVKIPDMHGVIYPIETESTLTTDGARSQANKFIPKNSIMVSCIATVGLVNIAVHDCQTNQQINSIVLNDDSDLYYLFFSMKRLKTLLNGVGSNGATMTNVNKAKFGKLIIIYPENRLKYLFHAFCAPIFEKILKISYNIIYAKEARDRLLPKLMSGELEV